MKYFSCAIRLPSINVLMGVRPQSRQFNERTSTVFNFLTHRTVVIVLAVRYYYEFKTSLDDVVKLMAMRSIELSH